MTAYWARFIAICDALIYSPSLYLHCVIKVEPMAARVHPRDVRSAHQPMHHLVADSEWGDTELLAAVAHEVLPKLCDEGRAACFWIIDDTGCRKFGKHSVGVARHNQ